MNKKISLGAAIAFMAVIAAITFGITMMMSMNRFNKLVLNVKNREEMYTKISDVDRELRQNFVDSEKIDEEVLLDEISKGFVNGLGDKYASYLTKDQYERRLKELSGKEKGIGIEALKDESGYLLIKKIYDTSPAKNSGMQINDHIVKINEFDVKTLSYDNATKLMLGDIGTKLKLIYRRDGVDTPIELIRKDITIPYVEFQMIEKNAHIRIIDFNERTQSQFKEAINKAISSNATGLILDVRNNKGEDVKAATEMLNSLLPAGNLGTFVDKNGKKTSIATSDKYSVDIPMVTLINGKTASAAELFAATLTDYNKSSCIGTKSFGKGSFQELIPLTDGSAVNVTTKRFLSGLNKEIEGVGIKPKYEIKLTPEQEQILETSTNSADDAQLTKAIEVVNSLKAE
ncbi:MAG: S41 family peptidase [Oscillospiraceae bacterium]